MSHPPYQGMPLPPGNHPGYGFPPPPPPPPAGGNARTIWIVGGVAIAVMVVLVATIGIALAVNDDNKETPTAGANSTAPGGKPSEPEPDDTSASPDDTDAGPGGTHRPVKRLCEKFDGTPLRPLFDTMTSRPSERSDQSTTMAYTTCVINLVKGSDRRQRAMVTGTAYYFSGDAAAERFFTLMRNSGTKSAKGPLEDVPALGDKAFNYASTTSSTYYSLKLYVLDENLVLHASVMASHATGWQPATVNQLKQGVVNSAKASLPRITGD